MYKVRPNSEHGIRMNGIVAWTSELDAPPRLNQRNDELFMPIYVDDRAAKYTALLSSKKKTRLFAATSESIRAARFTQLAVTRV